MAKKTIEKPTRGITMHIPWEVNECLEKYIKEVELQTGIRTSKADAIIKLMEDKLCQ